MRSSYKKNNYGNVFETLIISKAPELVVECGILDGFSLSHMATAVKFNKEKRGIHGHILAYDLFDDYEFKHGNQDEIIENLIHDDTFDYCTIIKADVFKVYNDFDKNTIDLLHFDVSNDGDTLIKMIETWGPKVDRKGIIVFEGGSEKRDKGWIKKYKKKPIRYELFNNPIVYKNFDVHILEEYPSLTLLFKK